MPRPGKTTAYTLTGDLPRRGAAVEWRL